MGNIQTFIKSKILSTSCIFLLLFLCCNNPKAPDAESTTKPNYNTELQDVFENYYKTMSDRDWVAYQTYFTPDATITSIWQSAQDSIPKIHSNSITDSIAQTKDGPDSQPIFEEKMITYEISVKQNLATDWVEYEAKFGTTDNLLEWKGNDLFSFIKYNDEWKIASLVFESIE